MLAGEPTHDMVPPDVVVEIADGRPFRAVWENEVGGLTFEIGRDPDRCFVKWVPPSRAWQVDAEAARLRWATPYALVPEVIDMGADSNGAWLLTRAIPGDNAVSPRWAADPATAVRAIGAGLRALHDGLPVSDCPFSWSAADRIQVAEQRAGANEIDPTRWHPIHQHLSVDDALAAVAHPPASDRLVVCHGDACAPNTLIGPDGQCAGHVDLGALGVADPWADLAVATWSTEWNYGPGWAPILLDAYGADPDPERTRYYRLLWDLGP
jgi:aminoglycoside phosphotransferase